MHLVLRFLLNLSVFWSWTNKSYLDYKGHFANYNLLNITENDFK